MSDRSGPPSRRWSSGETLSIDAARAAMGAVMDGEATPAQLAALLDRPADARRDGRGAGGLRARDARPRPPRRRAGRARSTRAARAAMASGTFNISTTAALVVAAAGRAGRQARQPRDDLGVGLGGRARGARHPDRPRRGLGGPSLVRELGFAFLFAAGFHPAMRHAGPTRREIGVRTAFNLLGPLTNPAGATPPGRRGRRRERGAAPGGGRCACSARSGRSWSTAAGVDELPLDGTGVIYDVSPRWRRATRGRRRGARARSGHDGRLAGGSPTENAAHLEAVLPGEPRRPRRDVVLLERRRPRSSSPVDRRTCRTGIDARRADDRRGRSRPRCWRRLRAEKPRRMRRRLTWPGPRPRRRHDGCGTPHDRRPGTRPTPACPQRRARRDRRAARRGRSTRARGL